MTGDGEAPEKTSVRGGEKSADGEIAAVIAEIPERQRMVVAPLFNKVTQHINIC
jgi:hypothetical protein